MNPISKIASFGLLTTLLCVCSSQPMPPPPPSCSDGVLNQSETDVDCGGRECASCPLTMKCGGPTDCESSMCHEVALNLARR